MACSTCMKTRKIVNKVLTPLGLPKLPVTETQSTQPPAPPVAQRSVNPAWPTRTPRQ